MDKNITPKILNNLFHSGTNIINYLKTKSNSNINTKDMIELSYDIQAGNYSKVFMDKQWKNKLDLYAKEISKYILSTNIKINTILDAGIGEATTMGEVLKNLPNNIKAYGFDISWSRVLYANKWLKYNNLSNINLCVADMFSMPYCDNSIDIVYTVHSIEPNGGKEKELLKELYRVAKHFIILFEPNYDIANKESKKRMDYHGYCKNLKKIASALSYNVISDIKLKNPLTKENPTSVLIIKKDLNINTKQNKNIYGCPKYKTPLLKVDDGYYSQEALCIYPVINNIPCLKIENSILASKYDKINKNILED